MDKGESEDIAISRAVAYAEAGLLDYGKQRVNQVGKDLPYGDIKQHGFHLINNEPLKNAVMKTFDSLDYEDAYDLVRSIFEGFPENKGVPSSFQELLDNFGIKLEELKKLNPETAKNDKFTFTGDINLKDGKSTRDNNIDLTSIFNHGGTKNGMSFKEALSYLLSINKIKQFALVHTIDSLKTAIKANGPCVGALPVYDSNRPDFWNGESLLGGHAISIVGWNKTGFIIRNSWGTQFGNNGDTYLPYTDINKFYEIWTIIN